jgi:hypothetical protein
MDAFEKLADPGFARDTALIVSGYAAAAMTDIATDRALDRDVPNEIAGLAVVAGAEYAPKVGGMQKRQVQLGGGAYTALAVADRIGIRDTIEEAI